MDKLIKWLENSFAPKLQKITNLTWIVVIKDSMMQLLPFILAGSIFCVGTILNDYIPALPSFWTPFGWTMSKIGLMASFLIPFNYCEKKRFRKQRILAGFTGTAPSTGSPSSSRAACSSSWLMSTRRPLARPCVWPATSCRFAANSSSARSLTL